MAEPAQKQTEDIIVRTMKGDLAGPPPAAPAPALPSTEIKPPAPISSISKEGEYKAPVISVAPSPSPSPLPPPPKIEFKPMPAPIPNKPPVLIVPPKIIPPKEIPEIQVKPLYKATPAWIKLGIIGLIIIGIALSGLYGYWKIFIQMAPPINSPTSTSTIPTLPIAPSATSTAPIEFFSKLPNKSITIDLPAKTPAALIQALKSEAKIEETRASVKQIKITYQGNLLTTEEFLNLFSIFTPKDFLLNYEDEFAFAFFAQKEGARPVLILKAKDKELAKTQIAAWEKATLTSDILPLFLNNLKLPRYLPSFRTYLFISQPVRFLNIGASYASLNYAIYNDYVIFTTSSAGMFVVLQDLTGQSISQSYLENLNASINEFTK